ncbi:ependymin-related protein 1 [Biomphalaria pfeifferi]|uniref:Ependymin-related protein 1 n=1 Tax=Biomphalaria pfeifferi TaxID=112525 RepID=A0AAD8AY14_BIOPF|nr:ependymin-related protein 1 [Biomphalaria pfeifferi]
MNGFFVFIVYLPLIVSASAPIPCCWYKQWEGFVAQKHGVYDSVGNFASVADIQGTIHMDYYRLMVVNDLVMTNASQVYALTSIEDYNKNVSYTIISGQCYKAPLRGRLQDNCVPENSHYLGNHSYLGIVADTWILSYYSKILTTSVRMTVTRDECIPIQEMLLTISSTSSLSFINMMNITEGIVDPNIFNIPSICQQTPLHSSQVPLMDLVGLHSFVKYKIV